MATSKGAKTGGRKKGSPNKKSNDLQAKIADFCKKKGYADYDPVLQLIEIAQDDETDTPLKIQAAKEVAQYIHPKRKALEVDQSLTDLVQLIIKK